MTKEGICRPAEGIHSFFYWEDGYPATLTYQKITPEAGLHG